MSATLTPGTLLGATSWVVTRSLGSRRAGRMYEVRHQHREGHWIVREIVPPPDLKDVGTRMRDLARTVLRLRSAVVPGAAAVVDHFTFQTRQYLVLEKVEGFTLDTAIRYRTEPLPRARLLEWTASLARTLQVLAADGRWTAVISATPEHLVVTPREELVLANPGLVREFLDGPAGDLGQGLRTFADTVLFMATGEARTLERVPPDLGWVLARCMSEDPARQYGSFGEVAEALRALGAPALKVEAEVSAAAEPVPVVPFEELAEVRQRLWPVAVVALLLLAVGGAGIAALHTWGTRPLPSVAAAVWTAVDRRLAGIAVSSRSLFGSLGLEGPVSAIAAPSTRLLVAVDGEKFLRVIDPVNGATERRVPTLGPTSELLLDPGGRFAYAVHPQQRAVGLVALRADAPETAGLVTAEAAQLAAAALSAPRGARLAVASAGRIAVYEVNPLKLVAETQMPSVSALAAGPGGATLHAARPDGIVTLDPETLREVDRRALAVAPTMLLADAQSGDLWWIGRSGGVGVLREHGRDQTFDLPGRAQSLALSGQGASRVLWVGLPELVLAVDPESGAVLARVPVEGTPTAMSVAETL